MNRDTTTIRPYTFGALTFRVRGFGVFIPSSKFAARVAKLTPEQIKAANTEAWKLRRLAERTMNRTNNVTVWGNGPYDAAYADYDVAKAVCTATWEHMRTPA